MDKIARIIMLFILSAGFPLVLAGSHSQGGSCGAGISSSQSESDDDDDDTVLSGTYDGQAYIVPSEADSDEITLTFDQLNTLQAETFGDAEGASVVWEVEINESVNPSSSPALSGLALKTQTFDPDAIGELFECDDDDLIVPGQCGAPPPVPGGTGSNATPPSDDDVPQFFGPAALGDTWSGQFQRPDGKTLGLTPRPLPSKPDIQEGYLYAMPDNCPCEDSPKDCYEQGYECVDRKKCTFELFEQPDTDDTNLLTQALCNKPDWDQVTLSFRTVTLSDGNKGQVGTKETSILCSDPGSDDRWTWYLFLSDSQQQLAELKFEIFNPDLDALVATKKSNDCPIDELTAIRKKGTLMPYDETEPDDIFAPGLVTASSEGWGLSFDMSQLMGPVEKFFDACGMTTCADAALTVDLDDEAEREAWWDDCGDEFNNKLTLIQQFNCLEAIYQLPPHFFTLTVTLLEDLVEYEGGGSPTGEDIQKCFQGLLEGSWEGDSRIKDCNDIRVDSCQEMSEQYCGGKYTKYCYNSQGNSTSCSSTYYSSDFHNCYWDTYQGQSGCWSYGSSSSPGNSNCTFGSSNCGDGMCNTTSESAASCPRDCWCGDLWCDSSESYPSCSDCSS